MCSGARAERHGVVALTERDDESDARVSDCSASGSAPGAGVETAIGEEDEDEDKDEGGPEFEMGFSQIASRLQGEGGAAQLSFQGSAGSAMG